MKKKEEEKHIPATTSLSQSFAEAVQIFLNLKWIFFIFLYFSPVFYSHISVVGVMIGSSNLFFPLHFRDMEFCIPTLMRKLSSFHFILNHILRVSFAIPENGRTDVDTYCKCAESIYRFSRYEVYYE